MQPTRRYRAQETAEEHDTTPPAEVPYLLGPYSSGLPGWAGPLGLRLSLRPFDEGTTPGWGVQIASAQIDWGYNRLGLEERVNAGGLDWAQAILAIEKLCACCSQANTLAFVQAVESIAQVIVPRRSAYLRMVLVESERIVSHLLNVAGTLEATGQPERATALRDLRERVIHTITEWTGARVQPGLIVYGGMARNIDDTASRNLMLALRGIERVVRQHVTAIVNGREMAHRLVGLGIIKAQEAALAGLRGPVARGSGVPADMRAIFPTGAYEDEAVTVVVQRGGDVFSRLVVRLLECLESFRVIEQALEDLPPGQVRARGNFELRDGSAIGRAEGPRGEVFCWARSGEEGLTGLHLSTGSLPTLGIIPGLLAGLRLDDLPLVLLSLDLCMASAER